MRPYQPRRPAARRRLADLGAPRRAVRPAVRRGARVRPGRSCWTPRPTPGQPGRSTLDLTVRAATGLAQSYLRRARPGRAGDLRRPAAVAHPGDRPAPALPGQRGADVDAAGRHRARRGRRRLRPGRPAAQHAARPGVRLRGHAAARRPAARRRTAAAGPWLRAAGRRRADQRARRCAGGAASAPATSSRCAPGGCTARPWSASWPGSACRCSTGTATGDLTGGLLHAMRAGGRGCGRETLPSRAVVRDVVDRLTVVATVAAGVAVAAVPDLRRPVLTAARGRGRLAVAAAVTRLRAGSGTLAVGPDHRVRPAGGGPRRVDLRPGAGRGRAASCCSRRWRPWSAPRPALGRRLGAADPAGRRCAGRRPRLGVAAAAVGASALVAATAAQTVVPSVGLVLRGPGRRGGRTGGRHQASHRDDAGERRRS